MMQRPNPFLKRNPNTLKLVSYSTSSIALTLALMACNTTPTSNGLNSTALTALSTGFLSDTENRQSIISAVNGWGSFQFDRANGDYASKNAQGGDGDYPPITMLGVQYDKGLGVNAQSKIKFRTDGNCSNFSASIGIDDKYGKPNISSVIFRVLADDEQIFASSKMVVGTPTQKVNISLRKQDQTQPQVLTLVVDDVDTGNYDQANWADARVECGTDGGTTPQPPTPPSGGSTEFLGDRADLIVGTSTNGWGPVQLNKASGDYATNNYPKMSIAGTQYDKGIGAHASSSIEFKLTGNCSVFSANVGIDDKYSNGVSSAIFQVFSGGSKVADSGLMKKGSAAKELRANLNGNSKLTLVVNNAGDGDNYDHADWVNARVECAGVNTGGNVTPPTPPTVTPPTPPTVTPPTPPTSTDKNKTIWYLPAPNSSTDTAILTNTQMNWMNNSSFDGVALVLRGISWDILKPGYTLNYSNCLTEAHRADAITKKKAVLILTNYPAPPTDTAAWAKTNAQFGLLARCLKEAGWVGLFHDPEPYGTQTGGLLPQPRWWDYGWWNLYKDSNNLTAWAARYSEQAKIVSDNFPGMVYGWYHSAAIGDGLLPQNLRQSDNYFFSLGAAWSGMVNAVAAGSANLKLIDMGEMYDDNLYYSSAPNFYADYANYRKNIVQNNLPALTAAGRAAWSSIVEIGFMRMTGHSTTTSTSNITQELKDMWSQVSTNGLVGYYNEAEPKLLDAIPSFIASGIQDFNNAGRR